LPRATPWIAELSILPAVSGEECARVLELSGFRRRGQSSELLLLESDDCSVAVPVCDVLEGGALVAILRAALIAPTDFVEMLGTLSVGRVPVAKPA
jgi:hypothetical protein